MDWQRWQLIPSSLPVAARRVFERTTGRLFAAGVDQAGVCCPLLDPDSRAGCDVQVEKALREILMRAASGQTYTAQELAAILWEAGLRTSHLKARKGRARRAAGRISEREVRRVLQHLVLDHPDVPIVSDTGGSGYWVATSEADLDAYASNLEWLAMRMLARARTVRQTAEIYRSGELMALRESRVSGDGVLKAHPETLRARFGEERAEYLLKIAGQRPEVDTLEVALSLGDLTPAEQTLVSERIARAADAPRAAGGTPETRPVSE